MKLTLGFSPCPNDTFIFDALIHHKIDTEGLEFEIFYDDVETLNQKAFKSDLDITKLSYHAFAYVAKDYVLLDAGSALGFGVGPILIANADFDNSRLENDSTLTVGIPGKYTTANFLLGIAYPQLQQKIEVVFSEIEQAVLQKQVDLGLIIHENRFTYQEKGLVKILDLGNYWEKKTGFPIPLGGIVIKRDLPQDVKQKVNRLIKKSVEYAFANPKSGLEFIRLHAQEMSEEVMYKHIALYVNKYSLSLEEEGKKAVQALFEIAQSKSIIPVNTYDLFIKS